MTQTTLSGKTIEGKPQLKEDKRDKDEFVEKLTFALTKPIIVYYGSWAIPERLKREVPLHRLAQLIRREEGKATDLECLIYLYPAAMEFPLSREWSRIYFSLFVQFMGKEKANFLKEEDYTLNDYEGKMLDELKEWIWDRQWEHYKEKRKQEKKAEIIAEENKQMKLV